MSANQGKCTLQNHRRSPGWYPKAIMANVDILNSAPFGWEEERLSVCSSLIDLRGDSCHSWSNGNGWIGEDGRDRIK